MHYSSLFSIIFQSTMVPTQVENSMYLSVYFLWLEPIHATLNGEQVIIWVSVILHFQSHHTAVCCLKYYITSMKNTDDFCYERKPTCATTKSILLAVSKDEWLTKENTGKSIKNALCILQYAKWHLSSCHIHSEKNQACGLSHCQVMLVCRHQAGS